MKPKTKDRRRYARVPLRVFVRLKTDKGIQHYYSKNISAGGIFLLSETPLSEETEVELDMDLPGLSAPVRARGEVVWINRQKPKGFAVKFVEISSVSRDFIRWLVAKEKE